MSFCEIPFIPRDCYFYPPGKPCSEYIGGKYVFLSNPLIKLNNTKEGQYYSYYLEKFLEENLLVAINIRCRNYLALLVCHYLYPQCHYNSHLVLSLPLSSNNSKVQAGNTGNICDKTCFYLHNEVCEGYMEYLPTSLQNLVSARFFEEHQDNIRVDLLSFIESSCLNITYYRSGGWNYTRSEDQCFYEEGTDPAGNCRLRVNNRNTRTRCEICSRLTIRLNMFNFNNKDTRTAPLAFLFGVFIVSLKHNSHLVVVFLLLNLNI